MKLQRLILAALALGCGHPTEGEVRLSFEEEALNLRATQTPLRPAVRNDVAVCPELQGELRFGQIPYRLPGEPARSSRHFAHFAAAYGLGVLPSVRVDYNRDGAIGCDEELPLLPHPEQPGMAFRTVKLGAPADEAPLAERRYRLTLPTLLKGPRQDVYFVDIVDVPVARWEMEGRQTSWLLFDGNYDGVFDKSFGDGVLVDYTGEGRISTNPEGENFFSFHLPLALPGGIFEVAQIDPQGHFMTLKRVPDSASRQLTPLKTGDVAQGLACTDASGDSVEIGASGKYQILYFWLSHCGGCEMDMEALAPQVRELDPSRFQAIGVSLDESPDLFSGFAARFSEGWTHCFTGTTQWDNAIARRLGSTDPSSFALLNPEGKLLAQGKGAQQLRQALQEIPR